MCNFMCSISMNDDWKIKREDVLNNGIYKGDDWREEGPIFSSWHLHF